MWRLACPCSGGHKVAGEWDMRAEGSLSPVREEGQWGWVEGEGQREWRGSGKGSGGGGAEGVEG